MPSRRSSASSRPVSARFFHSGTRVLALALSFLLGFATAAVLHAWLSAPQAVIYWQVKDAPT